MRYYWLALLLGLNLAGAPASADAIGDQPSSEKLESRSELINTMKTATLAVLQDNSKSFDARAQNLQNGFVNMVDIDWIAKFVLGASWRSATEQQRKQYVDLYRSFLMKTYVETFGQSRERKITDIKIVDVIHDADKFTARTELQLSTAERLKVDYLVVEKPGSNKIIDIVIENVSMLATHRAEFSKIAASKGIEGVIEKLRNNIELAQL